MPGRLSLRFATAVAAYAVAFLAAALALRRRASQPSPKPPRPVNASVPGSGTGVYNRSICLGITGSNASENFDPGAVGFENPVASNSVSAVNSADVAGPEKFPCHVISGQ